MNEPVVAELRDLEVRFPVRHGRQKLVAHAVDGVDLQIHRREIVALVGESGCGKTTIARTLMRLQPATSGSVWIDGADVTTLGGRALRTLRRRFQMIFQDPFESLPVNATALDVVMEGLAIHRRDLDPEARRTAALDALENCGLRPASAIASRRMFQLSGGQRQRVAIAAALAIEPDLLVADEPVSMLDVSLRAGILRTLLELRERLGVAIVFITHDLALASTFADRVAVLYLGRIVEEGVASEVIARPRHPYTRALVDVMPKADDVRRGARPILTGEPPNATLRATGCRFAARCPVYRALGEPEQCRTCEPELHAADPGHEVACHFPSAAETITTKENHS